MFDIFDMNEWSKNEVKMRCLTVYNILARACFLKHLPFLQQNHLCHLQRSLIVTAIQLCPLMKLQMLSEQLRPKPCKSNAKQKRIKYISSTEVHKDLYCVTNNLCIQSVTQ